MQIDNAKSALRGGRALAATSSATVVVTILTNLSGTVKDTLKLFSGALKSNKLFDNIKKQPALKAVSKVDVGDAVNESPTSPTSPTSPPAASSTSSAGSASGGGGGTLPIIGGAVGGIAVFAGIFAYWYFYMRKKPNPSDDTIPDQSRVTSQRATMDNPMMQGHNRDSIPLFVAHANLDGFPALPPSDPKRASTWDAPSTANYAGDAATNPMAYNQTNRLSTTQAINSSVNQQALFSNAGHGGASRLSHAGGPPSNHSPTMGGPTSNDDL